MRRLYFGGTFNPIHNGHLITSRAVAEQEGHAKITLIPSNQPPHKTISATMAATEHRIAMSRLAVANDPFFDVDDLETTRSGPSFTIDTVRALVARGETQVDWLIGADMLLYLPQWHRIHELLREVRFLIIARPGWTLDWNLLPSEFHFLRQHVVLAPLISISATTIRERANAQLPIRYLTPDPVCQYIAQHRLYQSAAPQT